MDQALKYLAYLVKQGGPRPEEYRETDNVFQRIMENVRSGVIDDHALESIWDSCGEASTLVTMFGFVIRKPHGYAGDFEIIDRIYTGYIGPDNLKKWDLYSLYQPALKAVCNRKEYFINTLSKLSAINVRGKRQVLNVGSGSGRDIKEFFDKEPAADIQIDCVDVDSNAIAYAKNLTQKYCDKITFYKKNILRFKPEQQYDLIWSAGLFDYFRDKTFKFCIRKFLKHLTPDGELVIGNFSTENPSRDYMEFSKWILNHRNAETLKELALSCGISPENITIHSEPEGVNLFLKIGNQDK